STTSSATVNGCAIPPSAPPACAPPPAWSKLAASSPLARVASAPACTGRWPAPTPSSPCAVANSAGASKTSGSAELRPVPSPPDLSHIPDVHPTAQRRVIRVARWAASRVGTRFDGGRYRHGLRHLSRSLRGLLDAREARRGDRLPARVVLRHA